MGAPAFHGQHVFLRHCPTVYEVRESSHTTSTNNIFLRIYPIPLHIHHGACDLLRSTFAAHYIHLRV